MGAEIPAYTTRELSKKTWPDFVKLFSPPSGWQHCWCVHFHRPRSLPKSEWLATRAERGVRNRREQKKLIDKGCSHGILVYAGREPVGWCQYGRREELTRIDNNGNYRGLVVEDESQKLWRITCFVVEKKHRRRGVAGAAFAGGTGFYRKAGRRIGGRVIRWLIGEAGRSGICLRMGRCRCLRRLGLRWLARWGIRMC